MDQTTSFEEVQRFVSATTRRTAEEQVMFYDLWADDYEKHLEVAEYKGAVHAVECLWSCFTGSAEQATVLDVACGTGLVAGLMSKLGFKSFYGVEGSSGMLQKAAEKGLYQELHQCLLGREQMPVPAGAFDVVTLVGALGVGFVPVSVVRELCQATKPGGYVCMTKAWHQDKDFKVDLEKELLVMEEEGLWRSVKVTNVQSYMRDLSSDGGPYIGATVYLYRKSLI